MHLFHEIALPNLHLCIYLYCKSIYWGTGVNIDVPHHQRTLQMIIIIQCNSHQNIWVMLSLNEQTHFGSLASSDPFPISLALTIKEIYKVHRMNCVQSSYKAERAGSYMKYSHKDHSENNLGNHYRQDAKPLMKSSKISFPSHGKNRTDTNYKWHTCQHRQYYTV